MALCKTTVMKVYNFVIEDVVFNVREIFSDEGIDEQILQELKALWESKLHSSKAVDLNAESVETPKAGSKKVEVASSNAVSSFAVKRDGFAQSAKTAQVPKTETPVQPPPPPPNPISDDPEDKMIPIQITLPIQPTLDAVTRVLTIYVPASALNGPQLHSLLTGPVITATMGLPTPLANSLLQQHVDTALRTQHQQQLSINKVVMPQMDGSADASPSTSGINSNKNKKLKKSHRKKSITVEFITRPVDGATDTSDEDDDASEDDGSDDEIDEEKEDEDVENDGDGAPEEEPLNSEDDVTDEEPADLFDTDNIVVCQYDKITRSRNKWKFYLKDGIMNLDGQDFIFQKANGDAEW